jgi:periplasmic copper chaperone A
LAADEFDEFLMLAKLPAASGPLAFPVIQRCGATENRWVETPAPGGPRPTHPAPSLTLDPAAPQVGHDHQH